MSSSKNCYENEQPLMLMHAEEESQQKDYAEVNCTHVMRDSHFCSSQQDCKPFLTVMENDIDDNSFSNIAMKPVEETQ